MARSLYRLSSGVGGGVGLVTRWTRMAVRLLLIPLLLALLSLSQPFVWANGDQDEGDLFLPDIKVEVVTPGKILYEGFEGGERKVFVIHANGGSSTELSAGVAGLTNAGHPTWSPDNMQIAFSAQASDAEDLDIWVMSASGSDQRPLTSDPAAEYFPAWSPDKSKIAFMRTQEMRTNGTILDDLFVMNADGSNAVNVTNHPARHYSLAWSPDSSKIVFVRGEGDSDPTEVFVMDADGSNLKNLSNNPGPDDEPTWSPDGSRIAFTSKQGPSPITPREIFSVNADGSGLTNLTQSLTDDFGAAWSLDGSTIAYVSYREQGRRFIYLMDVDGANQRRLSEELLGFGEVSWSPDSKHIAFIGNWSEPDPMGGTVTYADIGVIDATGLNLKRLTFRQLPLHPFWSH